MARPLRLQLPGGLYHVTARGNRREAIYLGDPDRRAFNELLEEVCARYNWVVHAACQMGNHYHLLVATPDGNLASGMRQLNGVYTQRFNARHGRVGHLFQGRYGAVLVDQEAYLLEVARYVVLNPVRARMVRRAEDWPWSSYRASVGLVEAPAWLDTDWILSQFGDTRPVATERFRRFVESGRDQPAPWARLRNQVFLGSDAFVERMQAHIHELEGDLSEVPLRQRRARVAPLEDYRERYGARDDAIAAAYASGGYSMKEIGRFFGLHYSRVSRILKRQSGGAKGKT
jgi:REP element-mobilizing transposase RayT